MTAAESLPTVNAIILADQFLQDKLNGKSILTGIFTEMNSTQYPANSNFSAYVGLENVTRPGVLGFYFKREDSDTEVKMAVIPIAADKVPEDPRESMQLGVHFRGFPFDKPGWARIIVKWDKVELGFRSLKISLISR
jgi:hypothetical protein